MIFHLFIISSAVQIYDFHIFIIISSPKRVHIELTEWPAPSWLDGSIGRAPVIRLVQHASRNNKRINIKSKACSGHYMIAGLREQHLNMTGRLEEQCFNLNIKAMFTRDRSQMDPTLSWNGPFLFTRYRSAYQRLSTRDRSVIVRYWIEVRKAAVSTS